MSKINFFSGTLKLQCARGSQQIFFSTAVKFQVVAKLKDILDKTSFQRRNHCLKGRQAALFDTFHFIVQLGWATRTDVQLHTCNVDTRNARAPHFVEYHVET